MKKVLGFLIISILISCGNNEGKVFYVENFDLYNKFSLTEELEKELQVFSNSISLELDSLKNVLKLKTEQLNKLEKVPEGEIAEYQKLNNHTNYMQGYIDGKVKEKSAEYDEKIWDRLNVYIKEYSEKENIDVLIGANGTGNLMFAKEEMNLTKEIIIFCNDKYAGK